MKLHYLDIYGRAEPIRMLLNHAKIEFEDVRYSREEFPEKKAELNLEFGQVPMLEVDGKQYTQSFSILRFLGSKHGYYPSDPYKAYLVDSFLDGLNDLIIKFGGAFNEKDPERQKELFTTCLTQGVPTFLAVVEKRLTDNSSKKSLVGESVSIADFALAGILFSIFYNDANDKSILFRQVLENFPNVKAYAEFLRDKALKEYLETRPPRPF